MDSNSFVIPAKAEIQLQTDVAPLWIPAFAGMTSRGACS